MKLQELFDILDSGVKPFVKFNGHIEDYETIFDKGMVAQVIDYCLDDSEFSLYKIKFAVNDAAVLDYNKRYMSSNYYDKNSNPTLNYIEAGMCKSGIEDCFFGTTDVESFDIINFNDFKSYQEFN